MRTKYFIYLSLVAITTLVSCNRNNTEEKKEPEDTPSVDITALSNALTKAQTSVNFSGSLTSIYVDDGESFDEGTIDVTVTDSFFEYGKTYNDYSGIEINYDYTFVKDSEGYVSYEYLTVLNTVSTKEFMVPNNSDEEDAEDDVAINYDEYCANPFAELKAKDFELIEGRYYLSSDKLTYFQGFTSLLSLNKYHIYLCDISSVSLELSGEKFTNVIITTAPEGDQLLANNSFFFDISLDLLFPGEISKTEVKVKDHRDEHDTLKTALTNLQSKINGQNYTIHTTDEESSGDYYGEWDNYATSEGFYSDFRALIDNYKYYYKKEDDGTYARYKHIVTGDNAGQITIYPTKYSNVGVLSRSDLEPNFLGFAPEFFIKSSDNSFTTTNPSVVNEIYLLTAPFIDKYYSYYIANKVFFNLDENNEITSWGMIGYDEYSGYTDTYTYTLKDIGTTVLPLDKVETSDGEN